MNSQYAEEVAKGYEAQAAHLEGWNWKGGMNDRITALKDHVKHYNAELKVNSWFCKD